jgi:hypothetical protein
MIGSAAQGTYQYDTLHWNGGVLLFTTNSAGQLDDIKIGAQGDILPLDSGYKGLTFYDRDPSGGVELPRFRGRFVIGILPAVLDDLWIIRLTEIAL